MDEQAERAWDIWSEGYLATGMEGIPAPAQFMGTVTAKSFAEACAIRFKDDTKYYDPKTNTYWMCRLFDNEGDARKAFG